MTRIPLIAVCVLALSGSAALAQTSSYGQPRAPAQHRMSTTQQAAAPMESPQMGCGGRGPHSAALTDEYGFKYDSCGNRLNARGYVISPHTK